MPVEAPEGTMARKVPTSVVRSTSTVGLPRESSTYKQKDKREIQNRLEETSAALRVENKDNKDERLRTPTHTVQ